MVPVDELVRDEMCPFGARYIGEGEEGERGEEKAEDRPKDGLRGEHD